MIINLINPNTCQGMTEAIGLSAKSVALPSTEILAINPSDGPASIESAFDEAIAGAALMDVIKKGEEKGVDAHIIACFGDPALDAAREIADAPVIGIAEAAFIYASLISHQFAIVTTMRRTLPISYRLLETYGYEKQCCSVKASDIPVLDLEHTTDETYQILKSDSLAAIEEDRAEAIVLGCAGMSNLLEKLNNELPVPVIDGVTSAVKLAESLFQLGLKTSKTGQYNYPLKKPFIGRYQHWNK